jgi:hypothetical protein
MEHSTTHKLISKFMNNPEVLTNPEYYLGPNYRSVLDFWFYVDSLNIQDYLKIRKTLNINWWKRFVASATNIYGASYLLPDAGILNAIISEFSGAPYIAEAIIELIALPFLLENHKNLNFLPAFNFSY